MNKKKNKRAKSFIEKYGTWEIYLAYRRKIRWKYSIPLDDLVYYLKTNQT